MNNIQDYNNNNDLYFKRHYNSINGIEIYNERIFRYNSNRKRYNPWQGVLCIKKQTNKIYKKLIFKDQLKYNDWGSGIEDPKIILFNNLIYVICNGLDKTNTRNMYIYSVKTNRLIKLWINNCSITDIKVQKN